MNPLKGIFFFIKAKLFKPVFISVFITFNKVFVIRLLGVLI